MASRNFRIESAEYVAGRFAHCKEMFADRLEFTTQANAFAFSTGLFNFAGNRHQWFLAVVHTAHDRDAETKVDLIVCPNRGVPA